MSVVTLNNNQVANLVTEAVAEMTGKALGEMDLRGLIQIASDEGIIGSVDQFTKTLINVMMRKWYLDTEYRGEYNSPFFEETSQFGAIIEAISITIPDAQPSLSWTDITSGTTQLGLYTIYLPQCDIQVFGKTSSFQIPVALQEEQLSTAFNSAEELSTFVSHVFLCIDNALVVHMEAIDAANRNSFMAGKINYASGVGATGTHVVNLVEEYVKLTGKESTGMTVAEYLSDPDALADGAKVIMETSEYFRKMTSTYNTLGKKRFTPKNRQVLQILNTFDKNLKYHMRSSTFHEDLVALPNYDVVPWWQSEASKDSIDVDIDVAGVKTRVQQSGIVALLCDKWAICHTIKKHQVAAKVFEPEHLTQYYYQFCDSYYNNLGMNGIVFIVADVNPS